MTEYIYDLENWPNFTWDYGKLIIPLGEARNRQGKLIGKMSALGFSMEEEAVLKTASVEIVKSFEIENEKLNENEVYSSIAKNLGMDKPGLIPSSRRVDGIVEMTLDAVKNYKEPLAKERLFEWHKSLFSENQNRLKVIGNWSPNQMYVISGRPEKEVIEYTAPSPEKVPHEMDQFLEWINSDEPLDPVLKAGIAHLWFLIIHPFEDGNGRIARTMTDMLLARADDTPQRFYSMSAQIQKERKEYYKMIQKTQTGTLDITDWLVWFLGTVEKAIDMSENTIGNVLQKTDFWKKHSETNFNDRQVKVIKLLLGDFDEKLTTSKWAKITKTSQDTALRDIKDLIQKGVLEQEEEGGRSTSYRLSDLK
ncbi:hypothetical protein MmiEs2_02440 [Methanimicrococcus stummii]|uniref:Fido domain-containing protein n=1 Tax=Methanimicrococcus stummii TaxID=3028294 RepID=A0AA96V7L9_9EURY|nr:Fic family protein [Methanimicrococcus sp. Es2]WNY28064.1 hypothetical protein MmiEs2_02440 [Methanimicrococcus sp. Es2]